MLSRILLNELVTMSIFVLRILEKKASDSKRKHHSYFSDKLLEVPYHMSQLTSSLCLPNRQDIMVFFFNSSCESNDNILCVGFFFEQEIPMNFVDPKEYDIPGLVRKNRYKTILPSKFLIF